MAWYRVMKVSCIAGLLGLVACGPSEGEPAEDVRVPTCDRDGPVRLLPDVLTARVVRLDDRLVVRGRDSFAVGDPDVRKIWAVGTCGEDPVELHEGTWSVSVVGDLLLACDGDGGVFRLDPAGERAPVQLLASASCRLELTDAGLLAHDPIAQEVLLRPSPHDDGIDVVPLVGEIAAVGHCGPDCSPYRPSQTSPFQTDGTSVFVVDPQSRLLRIDLQTRASTVVADGVADYVLLPMPDRLLIEDEDEDEPLGPTRLVDLTAATSQPLEAVALRFMHIQWPIGVGAASNPSGIDFGAFDLRTGARVGLPPLDSLSLTASLGGPRFVISSEAGPAPAEDRTYWAWSDVVADWVEVSSFASCSYGQQRDGRLEVLVADCGGDDGEIWLVDLDGGEPILAATGISGPWLSRGDRIAWSRPRSAASIEHQFGDLLVDDDGHRFRLDEHAYLLSVPYHPDLDLDLDLDGDVLYTVHDGERSGLWRSALP